MQALLRWFVIVSVLSSSFSQPAEPPPPIPQSTTSNLLTSTFSYPFSTSSTSSWIPAPSPECPYEPLPLSLDSLRGLELMGEMHDWNQYYVGAEYHAISFSLANASSFSMYLESSVSVEVWISDSSNLNQSSSFGLLPYHLVPSVLLASGDYYIHILFSDVATIACPTIKMEVSIAPETILNNRLSSIVCPATSVLPEINTGAITTNGLSYKSQDLSIIYAQPPTNTYNFLRSYPFSLPKTGNMDNTWEIEVIAGYHFHTAALGILLQDTKSGTPTDLSCFSTSACTISTRNAQGFNTLKVLLPPGDYTLWLYDLHVNPTFCTPFTFEFLISYSVPLADFLNCAGEPFPQNANISGFTDSHGYMHFRENVIISLDSLVNTFSFAVTEASYFRALVTDTLVDFTWSILNEAGVAMDFSGGDNTIQARLPVGQYTFQMTLSPGYSFSFCDTMLLELAIAPTSLFYDMCGLQSESTPYLAPLLQLSQNGNNFVLDSANVYRHFYSGNYGEQTIISQDFVVSVDSYLQAELGSNFLFGDVRLTVMSGTTILERGVFERNVQYLYVHLPSGNYKIIFETGYAHSTHTQTELPPCTAYTLKLSVKKSNVISDTCLHNRLFPTSLNTAESLALSPKVHIQEKFMMPSINSFGLTRYSGSSSATFTVATNSYFRVYTGPHKIDIDLQLKDGSSTIAESNDFSGDESISVKLTQGHSYTLIIHFYKYHVIDYGDAPFFFFFDAELAITPIGELNSAGCQVVKMPSNLGTLTNIPIIVDDEFHFSQQRSPSDFKVTFTVSALAMFRAQILYDFVWNDLALRLDGPGSNDYQGLIEYNKNEIPAARLPPGSYTLHIYEPFDSTVLKQYALDNCVAFHLQLELEVIDENAIDPLLLSCDNSPFPTNWSSPAVLSKLSGNMIDFVADILVESQYDYFNLSVAVISTFRLYIPATPFGVLVQLSSGGKVVAETRTTTDGDAELFATIQPATYLVTVFYANYSTIALGSNCYSYRALLSVAPVATLSPLLPLSTPCTTKFEINIAPAKNLQIDLQRSLQTLDSFSYSTLFILNTTYQFTSVFEQNFASSSLSMHLTTADGAVSYTPTYARNHIFLNEYLEAGTYNLSFHSVAQIFALPPYNCAPYSFTYSLVAPNSSEVPCVVQELPSYFLAQKDHSIHFYGEKFKIVPQQTVKYISFEANQPALLRLYINAPGSKISAKLANSSYALEATSNAASSIWSVAGQTQPYALILEFIHVDLSADCTYFGLEFVVQTEMSISTSITCPAKMPSVSAQLPPAVIDVYPLQTEYSFYSEDFIFSSEMLFQLQHSYDMKITVTEPFSLIAYVGFNFLVGDFALVLQNADGKQVVGIAQAALASDSFVNFKNLLTLDIPPGEYTLSLKDYGNSSFPVYCHNFVFSLSLFSQNATSSPTVLQIDPPMGSGLDSKEPLDITMIFSEPVVVALPENSALFLYLANYIFITNGTTPIPPSLAEFDISSTRLHLRFSPFFAEGATYNFTYLSPPFTTSDNTSFVYRSDVPHQYSMYSCQSSGCKGTCEIIGGDWVCVCQQGWTGSNCDRHCEIGYHLAGHVCMPDIKCANSSCNFHGKCVDELGYIACQCEEGFQGPDCSSCTFGYGLYPNCSLVSVEPENCTAPLLPLKLNVPEYLGFSGSVLLNDEYFVDTAVNAHNITFTVTRESVFRASFDWHNKMIVTIVTNQGTILESSRDSNGAPIILQPGTYIVMLRFDIMVIFDDTRCVTKPFQLAITPMDEVLEELESITEKECTNTLPSTPLNISDAYFSYDYSFSTPPLSNFSLPLSSSPLYFHNLSLTIAPPTFGQMASVRASAGSRFLGNAVALALDLESSPALSTRVVSKSKYGMFYGNENRLFTTLPAGTYTLSFYLTETLPLFSASCVTFDFSLEIEFVYDPAFSLPPLPLALDRSFYGNARSLNGNSIFYHFHDIFERDTSRRMAFNVTQRSFLRVASSESSLSWLQLFQADAPNQPLATYGNKQNIFAVLDPNSYLLGVGTHSISPLDIEFALTPYSKLDIICPTASILPDFTIEQIPFKFGNFTARTSPAFVTLIEPASERRTSFATLGTRETDTGIVAWFPFTLFEPGRIFAALEFDFTRFNMGLTLDADEDSLSFGKPTINGNILQEDLEAGSYAIRIEIPYGEISPELPLCAFFDFSLEISYATEDCTEGEYLPQTLNTLRFLGYDGSTPITYQADLRVESGDLQVSFFVANDSLLRVSAQAFLFGIDIKLLDSRNNIFYGNETGTDGESILVNLLPNVQYTLVFEAHDFESLECPTFNVEIAVRATQPSLYPARPPVCQNSGSLWPTIPANPVLPFYYYSADSEQNLYFQQQPNATSVNHSLSFTALDPIFLFVEIEFDFLTGELALQLESQATGNVWPGTPKLNKNNVNAFGLTGDTYTITIYQPSPTPASLVACSRFNFRIYISEYTESNLPDTLLYPFLPPTLDALAYLPNSTHLEGYYTMFDESHEDSISFTISDTSMFRVRAMMKDAEGISGYNPDIHLRLQRGRSLQDLAENAIYTSLEPGSYSLMFEPSGPSSRAAVRVQLAIALLATLQDDIDNIPTENCEIAEIGNVAVGPDGAYQYAITNASFPTEETDIFVPFSLERDSWVYARVGSDFLVSEVTLQLTNNDSSISLNGVMGRNIQQIQKLLPAGDYNLSLSLFPEQFYSLDYCAQFSFALLISASSTPASHALCDMVNYLPWQLDSANGASVPYGGPIYDDKLHFYGTNFVVPRDQPQSTIMFSLQNTAYLSVMVTYDAALSIESVVSSGDNITALTHNTISGRSHLSLFLLPPSPLPFQLSLLYTTPSSSSCTSFSLALDLAPPDFLLRQITCPEDPPDLPLPPTINPSIEYGAHGTFISVWNGWLKITRLTHDTIVTMLAHEKIAVTLEFNALAMPALALSLGAVTDDRSFVLIQRAEHVGLTSPTTNNTNMGLSIVTHIDAGTYALRVTYPAALSPFPDNELCLPFTFNFEIGFKTYVDNVYPRNYAYWSRKSLEITIIFSRQIYDNTNKAVTNRNSKPIYSAFYLFNGTSQVFPVDAAAKNLAWVVTFPPTEADSTYTLKLADNVLFGAENSPVSKMQSDYTYFSKSCSSHGVYRTDLVRCLCDEGYAGQMCSYCAEGYSGYPVCKRSTIITCPTPCANGYCDAQINKCVCLPNYEGPACDKCAPNYAGENCQLVTSPSKKSHVGLIVGILVAVVVVILGAVGALFWYKKLRIPQLRYRLVSRLGNLNNDDDL